MTLALDQANDHPNPHSHPRVYDAPCYTYTATRKEKV
jgi:hypothetical protein